MHRPHRGARQGPNLGDQFLAEFDPQLAGFGFQFVPLVGQRFLLLVQHLGRGAAVGLEAAQVFGRPFGRVPGEAEDGAHRAHVREQLADGFFVAVDGAGHLFERALEAQLVDQLLAGLVAEFIEDRAHRFRGLNEGGQRRVDVGDRVGAGLPLLGEGGNRGADLFEVHPHRRGGRQDVADGRREFVEGDDAEVDGLEEVVADGLRFAGRQVVGVERGRHRFGRHFGRREPRGGSSSGGVEHRDGVVGFEARRHQVVQALAERDRGLRGFARQVEDARFELLEGRLGQLRNRVDVAHRLFKVDRHLAGDGADSEDRERQPPGDFLARAGSRGAGRGPLLGGRRGGPRAGGLGAFGRRRHLAVGGGDFGGAGLGLADAHHLDFDYKALTGHLAAGPLWLPLLLGQLVHPPRRCLTGTVYVYRYFLTAGPLSTGLPLGQLVQQQGFDFDRRPLLHRFLERDADPVQHDDGLPQFERDRLVFGVLAVHLPHDLL
jgi:hypothetical protein